MDTLLKRGVIFLKTPKGKQYVKTKPLGVPHRLGLKGTILLTVFCALILTFALRGLPGNPSTSQINTTAWKDNGPFELSPERGRFALLYSVAEDHKLNFSVNLARFAAPDIGYINGKYVSIFAPGISIIAIPGYLLGKLVGLSQVGSFAVIALFALLNVLLIRLIAVRLGAHPIAATIGALSFLFGTPAFSYAVTLYEHHVSTFLILLSIYLLIRFKNAWSLFVVWLLFGIALVVDYPNLFLMLPIVATATGRFFFITKESNATRVAVSFKRVFTGLIVILPMTLLLLFNALSFNNPLQISGGVERAIQIKPNGTPLLEHEIVIAQMKAEHKKVDPAALEQSGSVLNFFKNRNLINGFYILFLSPDRGVLVYAPIMLLSIPGIIWMIKKKRTYTALLLGVAGFTAVLYGMWGDPYGGWAFGGRYLIPAYAMLAIFIAIGLHIFKKSNVLLLVFLTILSYSVAVNTLGAITTNANPPKVEAISMQIQYKHDQSYTFTRNLGLINENKSKSVFFQTIAHHAFNAWEYYVILTLTIILVNAVLLGAYKATKGENYAL